MSTPILGTDVRFTVAPPAAQPRPFGLLSVAGRGQAPPAGSFERGIDYWSPNCNNTTGSLDGYCPTAGEKEFTPFAPVKVSGLPRPVYSGGVCVQPGFDAEAEAVAQLDRGEQYRLESVFWADQLARADLVELSTPEAGDTLLACALGALEEWAAGHYAGRPVLHVPLRLIPIMSQLRLLERTADGLETPWGTPVSAGAGYGDPAATTPPAELSVLITGQVTLWQSDVIANRDFEPRTNEHIGLAERVYVVTADCLAAAIKVPICTAPTPGG